MSSGFITEAEIAERRKLRQEEWERVRQPNQPLEAPEEDYDPRSLYERLEEQKKKKEFEYEEAHRLKNMIKGLDDDEVDFLDLVDRSKMEEERKKTAEEEREMADFRNRVASLQEQGLEQRIHNEIRQPLKVNNNIKSGKVSQSKLLAGAVVKKRPVPTPAESEPTNKKRSRNETEDKPDSRFKKSEVTTNGSGKDEENHVVNDKKGVVLNPKVLKEGSLTCIGILPGMGTYDASSDDSDCSSEAEEHSARFDLLGRLIENESEKQSNDKHHSK
ncbi:protein FAM192A isoform X1 [Cimex lectularius]|uniref:FAM192A/Fyv6 N-terminal domain-containing protein n=1 Tax=Cimex lectularius TaxID=79782 RepID=A0A8I6R9P2_CIMLE|nr:protein FAM192A isoform X1 [Cimex lectularius]XP_014241625.1 protein FAM192A isoform X1 [Cimex lectularius]